MNALRVTIAGITLLGLVSCAAPSVNSPSTTNGAVESAAQAQTVIKIAPSSSTATALKILTEAYQRQHPNVEFDFIANNQSGGAIVSLKNKMADIAGISHQLKPEEDNGQIQYRELAKDLLVVATHSSVKEVTNLSTQQLRDIYSGKISNWKEVGGPDAAIVVLDRPEDESAKKMLRKHYLGDEPTTSKAVILSKENELIQTLQDTPYAIGVFSLAHSFINRLPVNHLSLDNQSPTIENLKRKEYSMARNIGIVWDKTPSTSTQEFIQFISSSEATKALQDKGFIPSSSQGT